LKRILITGMSGTGKSAVIEELRARGVAAHDLDTPEWSEWVTTDPSDTLTPMEGQDWRWREDRVRNLLSGHRDGRLFISGTAENMSRLFPLIDSIVLLSAPPSVILERLKARPAGYGHSEAERRKVLDLISTIEPLLRQAADLEIDTRKSVKATVDEILRLT
jgi:dephospho-CoA kinase